MKHFYENSNIKNNKKMYYSIFLKIISRNFKISSGKIASLFSCYDDSIYNLPLFSQLYSDPNVVVAKMNAVNNDVPLGYDVQG